MVSRRISLLFTLLPCIVVAACAATVRQTAREQPDARQTAGDRGGRKYAAAGSARTDDTERTAQRATIAAAMKALRQGQYAFAERALEKLVSGKTAGKALLVLARLQMETGRYDEAEQTAAAAERYDRLHTVAVTVRAEALLKRGRLDRAEKLLRSVAGRAGAHRARLVLGWLLQERGRHAEAEPFLLALIDAYNDQTIAADDAEGLTHVAMAAWALGSLHDANDTFREAGLVDGTRVQTQLQWARLFLEKNDIRHARESVDDALRSNPNSAEAHALMARLLLDESFDFPAAEKELDLALSINPNLVMAHVTRAGMALRNMQIKQADEHLEKALAVNPNDLEALSMKAAVRFLADDGKGFEQAQQRVLRRNPRFSRMYSIIARYAEWEHRYPELIEMAHKALELDPEDASAHATLGLNLLRVGREEEGLRALNQAWERDRFNVLVFNTLNLYDNVIRAHYERFDARPFRIRMHRGERLALEPYLVPMLRRAYKGMVKRYGFTPQGPIDIELYADRRHFSVRTTGLPSAGVQGVCFGKVVTAVSPRAGAFNWGQITWHELSHVFHLQLSKNHVPRWFTEGLAEYETMIARPEWKREEDHRLWLALKADRLPHLSALNTAFTGAKSPNQLMTAYYAATQAAAFIVERFGMPAVVGMLRAWGRGRSTSQVVSDNLGLTVEQLDEQFRRHTLERLAAHENDYTVDISGHGDLKALQRAVNKSPRDADALASLAIGYLFHDKTDPAAKSARKALALKPNHAKARFAMTRVALERGDIAAAEGHLRAILAGGKDGYVVRLLLARAAIARRDHAEAKKQAQAAIDIDPERAEAWQIMVEVAGARSDAGLLLHALRSLVDIDQHDRRSHKVLLGALADGEDWDELVRYGERALFVDPENPEIHRLLGLAYLEKKRFNESLRELDQALVLGHPRVGEIHLHRARALLLQGKRSAARRALKNAEKADPALAPRTKALVP